MVLAGSLISKELIIIQPLFLVKSRYSLKIVRSIDFKSHLECFPVGNITLLVESFAGLRETFLGRNLSQSLWL